MRFIIIALPKSLVVWFDDVIHYVGTWNGTYDFQMIIYSDSRILLQYRTVSGDLDSSSIGIQNATGDDGLTVCFNENYVEDNLAVLFIKDWLEITPVSGSISQSSYDDISITFDAEGLVNGTYQKNINISSNDPDESIVVIPVTLNVGITAPETPQNINLEIIGSTLSLSWDSVSGATSYTVYSDTDPYGAFTTSEWTGSNNSWSESITGEKKFYQVTVRN